MHSRFLHLRISFSEDPVPTFPGPALVLGRNGPQVGYDRVEVGIGHIGVILESHRSLERRAVAALAPGDRGLDLGVGPVAKPRGLARGDVARVGDAPGPREFAATLAERSREVRTAARRERRVALHAMADGDEIEAHLRIVA